MFNKTLFSIFILLTSCNLYAQHAIEISGQLYHFKKNEEVQGSPLLYQDWKNGKVVLVNGAQFDNMRLKFDAELSRFLYNRNDTIYEFINELTEVRLYDPMHANDSAYAMIFKNNISTGGKLKPGSFVQVLADGKITLLKEYVKNIEGENRTDGYRSSVKQYVLRTNLWAVVNNQAIPAKFSPDFLEQLTPDKRSAVDNYIKANGLKVKTEKGFISAIAYYNLISKQ